MDADVHCEGFLDEKLNPSANSACALTMSSTSTSVEISGMALMLGAGESMATVV